MGISYNCIEYFTHGNGARPFKVVTSGMHLEVYTQGGYSCDCPEDECICDCNNFYQNKVCEYDCMRVFIGKSPRNTMTEFSGGYGPEFDGNSILALLSNENKYKYVYIGDEIYTFEIDDEIVLYLSHVGNNDVPYPYGITSIGDYVFMIECTIMKFEPYIYYYDSNYGENDVVKFNKLEVF